LSLKESFHEHGRHDVLLGMTGRVKQVVTQSWQGQQPDAASVNRGTFHGDGLIDKEQTNQMSDAAPVDRCTLHGDGSIFKQQATTVLSQDKESELGMSQTITSEVGTAGRSIQVRVGRQAVGTQSAAGSEHQTSDPAQHVQTTDQILTASLKPKLKGQELRMALMEKLQHCTLSNLKELAVGVGLNPDVKKSELAGNIFAVYCSTQGDSVAIGQVGNPVCSNIGPSELGMSQTIMNEDGKAGRPIRMKGGGQAVGTQSAAGSAQQTSPPAQLVETTGQRNLGAFLDRKLNGEDFESGLLQNLEQCSLEDLQKLAAEANLNSNLEKGALVSIIYRKYFVGSDGESEEGNDDFLENELLSGRDDKSEASYARTHGSKRSDVGEEYSALAAIAGGQSKGAGTKVRLPSLCSRKKQLRCMAIRQMPRCGFACVVIISRAAQSAVARCPVCQCACMRNPLTSGSIPVAIHLCNSSCFLDCMACYHKKTVAVSEENNMKRWPVGGKLQLEEGCCI